MTRRGLTCTGMVVFLSFHLVREIARLTKLAMHVVFDFPRIRIDVRPADHDRIRRGFQVPSRLKARRALQQLVRFADDEVLAVVPRLTLANRNRITERERQLLGVVAPAILAMADQGHSGDLAAWLLTAQQFKVGDVLRLRQRAHPRQVQAHRATAIKAHARLMEQ